MVDEKFIIPSNNTQHTKEMKKVVCWKDLSVPENNTERGGKGLKLGTFKKCAKRQ